MKGTSGPRCGLRPMARARLRVFVLFMLLVVLSAAPGAASPAQSAIASQAAAAPAAVRSQQVVALDTLGRIRAYSLIDGQFVLTWISPDTTVWTNFALGDFDADYRQEIVATSSRPNQLDRMQILHPVPGSDPLDFVRSLGSGSTYHLLATGHFKDVPGDQIISSYYFISDGTFYEVVDDWTGVNGGRYWPAQATTVAYYTSPLQTIAAGDTDRDGRADLVLASNTIDKHPIEIQSWRTETTPQWARLFYDEPGVNSWPSWNAIAVGRVLNTSPAWENQIAASLSGPALPVGNATELVMRLVDSDPPALAPLTGFQHDPVLRNLALANLNGNALGLKQIVGIGDPGTAARPGIVMIDPAGTSGLPAFQQSVDPGAGPWRKVAAGDVDGDGRDEVAVVRPDKIRVFTQPEINTAALEIPAPAAGVSWASALAIGDLGLDYIPVVDPGMSVRPASLSLSIDVGGSVVPQRTLTVERAIAGGAPIHWTATAVDVQSLPQVLAALSDGSAKVTAAGLEMPSGPAAVSAWVQLTPDQGTTNSTITVSVRQDWTRVVGYYRAVILLVPDQPFNADWIRTVPVTLYAGHLYHMPVIAR